MTRDESLLLKWAQSQMRIEELEEGITKLRKALVDIKILTPNCPDPDGDRKTCVGCIAHDALIATELPF